MNDCPWQWTAKEQAFQAFKQLLTSSQLLVHFHLELKLLLLCDASAYGVRAVLAHLIPGGSERPIADASRALSKAERNWKRRD